MELFDWDSTKKWRQMLPHPYIGTPAGWGMLDDPQAGPLLRIEQQPIELVPWAGGGPVPVWNSQASKLPLDPVWVAVEENNLSHLSCFIKENLNLDVKDGDGHT